MKNFASFFILTILLSNCTGLQKPKSSNGNESPLEVTPLPTTFASSVGKFCSPDFTKGFRDNNFWIWGSTVIQNKNGKYHMFASRWPKKYPMFEGYLFYSHIVHAIADNIEGPYNFVDTAIGPREGNYWDSKMAHNPCIKEINGKYYL